MKIVAVGGGSGGHIIPVVAVVEQINQLDPTAEVYFWCDRKSLKMAQAAFASQKVTIRAISAGKFRRYHHFKWWQHLRPSIIIPNLIDIFRICFGFLQSFWLLWRLKPDVIFAKGGFVCLPVGVVAHVLGIKLVIHDSDTVAGLTNRVLSKYAVKIATGMPTEYYHYPQDRTIFVGSPIKVVHQQQAGAVQDLRRELGLSNQRIVLVSGGGLGSEFLNSLVLSNLQHLDQSTKVILITGVDNYHKVLQSGFDPQRLIVKDFVTNFQDYLALAEIVVARAGATTIAELAAFAKPTIFVPNPKLVEGHQLKNAQMLVDKQAALVLDEFALEKAPEQFSQTVNQLLADKAHLQALASKISQFAKPDAARRLAEIIIEVGEGR